MDAAAAAAAVDWTLVKVFVRVELGLSLFAASLVFMCSPCIGHRCRLRTELRGRYFQGGVGEVIVRERTISTKGTCVEQNQNYYLFDQRRNGCFLCLKFYHRHENVLQYKESFCVNPDKLKKICALISEEDVGLFTLVREPFVIVTCPFDVAYFFNYNDVTYGFCSHPMSYARPCANRTVYHLQFRHCVLEASYNGQDVALECIAKWKADSENFLYGRLSGISKRKQSHVTSSSNEDSYRCFKYRVLNGGEVFLSMSCDAGCQGLRSYADGPIVLEMVRDDFGWPDPSCRFPEWLREFNWRDLSGTFGFRLSDSGQTLTETHLTPGSSGSSRQQRPCVAAAAAAAAAAATAGVYRCVQLLDYYHLEEEYVILSFSTINCISKLQCLKLRQRSDSVVEFYPGRVIEYGHQGHCISEDAFSFMHLITPADGCPVSVCPEPGLHHTALRAGCLHRLDVGCRNESIIQIESTCGDQITGLLLECVAVWTTDVKTSVVTRDPLSNGKELKCFSFERDESDSLVFAADYNTCQSPLRVSSGYPTPKRGDAYITVRNEQCHSVIDLLPLRKVVVIASSSMTPELVTASLKPDDSYHDDDDVETNAPLPTVVMGDDDDVRRRHSQGLVDSDARWSSGLSFTGGDDDDYRRRSEFYEERKERKSFGRSLLNCARANSVFVSSLSLSIALVPIYISPSNSRLLFSSSYSA